MNVKQLKPSQNKMIIKTNRFLLKRMKLKYANKNYLNWFNDKETKKFIEFNPNNELSILRENIKRQLKERNVIFFAIFFKKKHIGNIKFEKINLKKSTAYLGILIGDERSGSRF